MKSRGRKKRKKRCLRKIGKGGGSDRVAKPLEEKQMPNFWRKNALQCQFAKLRSFLTFHKMVFFTKDALYYEKMPIFPERALKTLLLATEAVKVFLRDGSGPFDSTERT